MLMVNKDLLQRQFPTLIAWGIFAVTLGALAASLWRNAIYPLSVVSSVFALAGVVALLTFLWTFTKRYRSVRSWLWWPLVLFIVLSCFSLFFSQTKTVGFNELLLDVTFVALVVALPYWWRQVKQDYLVSGLLVLGIVNAGWGLSQYLTRSEPRIAGLFFQPEAVAHYYPNAFALSCLLLLPLALYFLLAKKQKLWQLWGLVSTVFLGTGLVLSWSRGGWLGAIAILLIVIGVMFTKKRWQQLLRLGAVLVLIVALTGLMQGQRLAKDLPTNNFIAKAQFEGTEAQTSVGERSDFIVTGLELSLEHPIFGFGPGSFPYVYPRQQDVWLANAPHPHNWFVKLAVERGWLATVVFASFWLILLYFAWLKRGQLSGPAPWALLAVVAGMGHNLIDFNFNFVFNVILLALLVSLLLGEDIDCDQQPKTVMSDRLFQLAVLFLVFGIAVIVGPSVQKFEEAETLQNQGEIQAAYDTYLQVLPLIFVDELYLRQAYLAEQLEDNEAAMKSVEKHLQFNPVDAAVWNRFGDYLWQAERTQEALFAYNKALALDPRNNWSYYYNRLNALRVLNDQTNIERSLSYNLEQLNAYVPLAEMNVHYTAQSPNLDNAILMAELMTKYVQGDQKTELDELILRLRAAKL